MQVGIESTGTYSVLVCELGKYQLNVLNVKITMYIFFSKEFRKVYSRYNGD